MGIPRLTSRLEHFREVVKRTKFEADQAEQPNWVEIDGPSLAYHIYREWVAKASSSTSAGSEGTHKRVYAECGAAAVAWLERLETFGFKIDTVLFDGGLPVSKRPTRLARLQDLVTELATLRARYDEKAKLAKSTGLKLSDITQAHSPLPQDPRQQPTPPFLVFAVVEALFNSRFNMHARVVQGEADAWCAASAHFRSEVRNEVAYVFSSDSDLFVHDIGRRSWLVMFNDFDYTATEKEEVLTLKRYSPANIAHSHGLRNLVKTAHLMSRDPHKSFKVAVEDAGLLTEYEGFSDFEEEYRHISTTKFTPTLAAALERMDSRVSEYIYDVLHCHPFGATHQFDVFLPPLIEDPARTSAWHISRPLRNMVYSFAILLSRFPTSFSICEHLRSGYQILPTNTRFSLRDRFNDQLLEWASHLEEQLKHLNKTADAETWRSIAVRYVLTKLKETEKPCPSFTEATRVARSRQPRTWEEMHFSAQVEATLYSVRMMKQVLEAIMIHVNTEAKEFGFWPIASRLQNQLPSLPGIPELFDFSDGSVDSGETDSVDGYLRKTFEELAIPVEREEDLAKSAKAKKKAEKKRKRGVSGERVEGTPRPKPSNPFAALAE